MWYHHCSFCNCQSTNLTSLLLLLLLLAFAAPTTHRAVENLYNRCKRASRVLNHLLAVSQSENAGNTNGSSNLEALAAQVDLQEQNVQKDNITNLEVHLENQRKITEARLDVLSCYLADLVAIIGQYS